jgi:hypothetical protein
VSIPKFWLSRPDFDLEPHRDQLTQTLQRLLEDDDARSEIPLWAFLCWLCDERGYAAHGTGRADILEFEPRPSNDVGWFGNRKAVYAASDGLWAMFFAIMNRPDVPMTIVNAAMSVEIEGRLEPRYFFGATRDAVEGQAFRDGWVYLLPGATFEREPGGERGGVRFETHHLASLESVRPAFRLAVRPQDFPFLSRIHSYDEDDLVARVERDPNGFPWVDDLDG